MDSFPECFTFRYYSVNVSRQLGARLNEVPLERSILVDFAAFHLDSLNGKLNGTREENMPGSKWTQHEASSPQRLKRCLVRNLHIFAPMGRHVGQCKNRQPIFSFIHPTPCVRWWGGEWIPLLHFLFYKSVGRLQKPVFFCLICYNSCFNPYRIKITRQAKFRSCPISVT